MPTVGRQDDVVFVSATVKACMISASLQSGWAEKKATSDKDRSANYRGGMPCDESTTQAIGCLVLHRLVKGEAVDIQKHHDFFGGLLYLHC